MPEEQGITLSHISSQKNLLRKSNGQLETLGCLFGEAVKSRRCNANGVPYSPLYQSPTSSIRLKQPTFGNTRNLDSHAFVPLIPTFSPGTFRHTPNKILY